MTGQAFTAFDFRNSSITKSVQGEACPWKTYSELTKSDRMSRADGVVNLFRRDDIMAVNRHPAVLGQGGAGPSLGAGSTIIPNEVDGEMHQKYRRVLDSVFSPKRVAVHQDYAVKLANDLIDAFIDGGEVEATSAFCEPFTAAMFLRILDAPAEDVDLIAEVNAGIIRPRGDTVEEIMAVVNDAGTRMFSYVQKLMDARRAAPELGDDLISMLLASEMDGAPLPEDDVNRIVYSMLLGGFDTTASATSLMLATLAAEPAIRRRIVDDPKLLPGAIEEILRRETTVPANTRFPTEDIDLGDGLVIKAGETIHTVLGAANVDATVFDDPTELHIDKPRRDHLVFSSGTHRCLGSHLARFELRVAVGEFLRRIPEFSLKEFDPPRFDNITVRKAEYLPLTFTAATP